MDKRGSDLTDILFTAEWPQGILNNSPRATTVDPAVGSRDLADFVKRNPAKYHISVKSPDFFEREPYENLSKNLEFLVATRFINLGNVGSDQKWIYAFNISPCKHESKQAKMPDRITRNPFTTIQEDSCSGNFIFKKQNGMVPDAVSEVVTPPKRAPPEGYLCKRCRISGHFIQDCPESIQSLPSKYVCRACNNPGHHIKDCPKRVKVGDGSTNGSCWFCLANPAIRKHLILDIGDQTYLALARGGLVPKHCLLVPIEHVPAVSPLDESIELEMEQNKMKLRGIFGQEKLTPVFITLRQSPTHHFHVQCIPIKLEKLEDLMDFIIKYAEGQKLAASKEAPLDNHYCKIEFDDSILYLPFGPDDYFPSQFGRECLVKYLDLPSTKSDWKSCLLSDKEESLIVNGLKVLLNKG